MLIDLAKLMEQSGIKKEIETEFGLSVIASGGEEYPVTKATPVKIGLNHLGKGRVAIEAFATIDLTMPCARCLTDVPQTFDLAVEEECTVLMPGSFAERERAKQTEEMVKNHGGREINAAELDSLVDVGEPYLNGSVLDTDALVYNDLMLNLPLRVLCKEDCKGLCPQCGKDRNLGDCGCDTFVPDPRMAAILDLFKESEKES